MTRTEAAVRTRPARTRGLAIGILTAVTLALAASPAAAVTPKITGTTSMRDCVKTTLTGCATRYTIPAGTTVKMHCYADDSWATGAYSSNRWFYVTTSGEKKGFVHSSRVDPQSVVGKCRDHRGIATARWASEHVGITKTTTSERAAIPTSTTYWSGYCATFTRAAFKLGARVESAYAGDARPRYFSYRTAGRVVTSGTPSVGAQVFYPYITKWGHVAIYVGNGMVATTMGLPGETLKNERVPMTRFGTPAGWVNPDKI